MMTSHATGAAASTASAAKTSPTKTSPATRTATRAAFIPPEAPGTSREHVRHLLFGTASAVQTTIRLLHKLGYAEPNDWSKPIATGRVNEVMSILTKRVEPT